MENTERREHSLRKQDTGGHTGLGGRNTAEEEKGRSGRNVKWLERSTYSCISALSLCLLPFPPEMGLVLSAAGSRA